MRGKIYFTNYTLCSVVSYSYTSSNVTFVVLKKKYYNLANHATVSDYHALNFKLSFSSSLPIKLHHHHLGRCQILFGRFFPPMGCPSPPSITKGQHLDPKNISLRRAKQGAFAPNWVGNGPTRLKMDQKGLV